MEYLWILFGAAGAVLIAAAIISYICYRMAFYVPPRRTQPSDGIDFPEGEIYEKYHGSMKQWALETRAMPHEDVQITAFDGLTLYGKFYEFAPGAPIELMFHGYRSNAERDLSGGVQRCFKIGRSALIVDQRCSGKSEGHTITFGIKEHRDCLSWIDFAIQHFGPEVKLILTGISMGASTVLMAAGKPLPPNVIGVLADCGYTTAKDIIQVVIRQMGLPPRLSYPFVKLGARLYGGFDPEEYSALEAMQTCRVPVIFFHGTDDDYVPCRMSRINYEACTARKSLVLVPGAGHGLSYPVDPDGYLAALRTFFGPDTSSPL